MLGSTWMFALCFPAQVGQAQPCLFEILRFWHLGLVELGVGLFEAWFHRVGFGLRFSRFGFPNVARPKVLGFLHFPSILWVSLWASLTSPSRNAVIIVCNCSKLTF